MTRSVDIIVPLYNEERCVTELVTRLRTQMDVLSDYRWRAILVENGSRDATWPLVHQACGQDARFVGVRLSRNFGMDGALTAGLSIADGDAVVMMAGDLQDPPEVIGQFIRAWEGGASNVYAEIQKRHGTGPIRRLTSWAFYRIANLMTGGRIPRNASDFRLLDRALYQAVRDMGERSRFVRGLVAWAGFPTVAIPIERPPRFAGESKAYSLPMLGMAFRAILAHSYFPLRLITLFGLLISVVSVAALGVNAYIAVVHGVPFAGFGTLVSLILLAMGVITLMLGVIAEYISMIYEEVKQRPNFVVRETIGLSQDATGH